MAAPLQGSGFLIANDRLTDAAFLLIQPSVSKTVPVGGIAMGSQTVLVWDPSMYVGAQIIVGTVQSSDVEVVTITATVPGVSFTAVFTNPHLVGEPIYGATFPVRNPTDQLFTQSEMLANLSTAQNDLLTDIPLLYFVADITVPPMAERTLLPSDCQFPVRVAYNQYPLKETSKVNLDGTNFLWTQQGLSEPTNYFRDKVPLQNIGIWPRAGNTTPLEVVYATRGPQVLNLADGFAVPDPITIYILYRTMAFAFSKDGEMRNPALAKYFQSRYDLGVKALKMYLDILNDPLA